MASGPMAMAGLGRPVAIRRGTVAHTGSSPADPHNNTRRAGPGAAPEEAAQTSAVQVGHRLAEEA